MGEMAQLIEDQARREQSTWSGWRQTK